MRNESLHIAKGPHGLWSIDSYDGVDGTPPMRAIRVDTHITVKGRMHYIAVRDRYNNTILDAYLPLTCTRAVMAEALQWLEDMAVLRSGG